MKQLLFALLPFIFVINGLLAQDGFNKKFGNPFPGVVFYSLLLDEDTLIIYGIGVDSQQYISLAKLDTFGNIGVNKKIYDPQGRNFLSNLNYGIIKDGDTNYRIVGEVSTTGFMAVFNKKLEQIKVKEYFDPNILAVFQRKILDVDDGYIISGYKAKPDYTSDIFLMKIDSNGSKLWEKAYGKNAVIDVHASALQINPNHFVVSGARTNPQGTPLASWWAHCWIFGIDSLGNKLWEFEGERNKDDVAVGLQHLSNGGWMYGSTEFELLGNNEWGSRTKVVCRDSAMNLLWELPISPTAYSSNRVRDIVPSPDGTYVVISEWTTQQTPGSANYGGGCISKVTPAGELLWSELFTGFPEQPKGTANYLGGVAVLPSGSIIATGYTRRFSPGTVSAQGWVIKLNPDGCVVDTLCQTSFAEEPTLAGSGKGLLVYPNPASETVNFQSAQAGGERFHIQVADLSGRQVWRYNSVAPEQQAVWDSSRVPPGVYIYRCFDNSSKRTKAGKIVIE